MPMAQSHIKGQSLVEVLVALTVGAIMIGGASMALFVSVRSNASTRQSVTASELAQQLLDNIRVVAESDWNEAYNDTRTPATHYVEIGTEVRDTRSVRYINIALGNKKTTVDNIEYTESFTISDVNRNSSGAIVATGGTLDPSTLKISITVSWAYNGAPSSISVYSYITRTNNYSPVLSGWDDGDNIEGPLSVKSPTKGFSSSSGIDYESQPGAIRVLGF